MHLRSIDQIPGLASAKTRRVLLHEMKLAPLGGSKFTLAPQLIRLADLTRLGAPRDWLRITSPSVGAAQAALVAALDRAQRRLLPRVYP